MSNFLDSSLSTADPRETVFAGVSRDALTKALASVESLVRPSDDVYFRELNTRYRAVRLFLPNTVAVHSIRGKPIWCGCFSWL